MNKQSPAKTVLSRTYGVVRLILLFAIVGYLGWQIYAGRAQLASLVSEWDGASLAGALLSAFIAYQCLFLGWVILLRRSGHFSAGQIGDYLRIWWVSYIYRYVPGKVLLVVERARMGAAVGIPPIAGAALAVVETLLAILAGSAVSLLAISYYVAADSQILGGVVLLVVAAVLLFPAGFRFLVDLPIVRGKFPELESVAFRSRDILAAIVPYMLFYLLSGLSLFLVSRSLNLFSLSALAGLCGIYALSHVVGLVAIVAPGGLGVREGALAVQLGRLLPHGVAEALAIGLRLWFTLVELICYFGVLVLFPSRPDRFK